MKNNQNLVEMKNIYKYFGTVTALRNVDFQVKNKEILGLVGDNGAGKSTLIKILTGVFPSDRGEIFFEGKKIKLASPKYARDLGIETVYQNLALIDLMSIARNFFLGREPVKALAGVVSVLDKKKIEKVTETVLKDIGINVRSVDEEVSILSGGERQSVAIGRAIHFGAKLLVLDEPTAALSIKESHKVLNYVLEAKKRGLSVIFITHNIYHVYSVADRFTILEHGEKLGDFRKDEVCTDDLIEVIRTGKKIKKKNNK
jgi:simple sugar transport system ATP-binding protein